MGISPEKGTASKLVFSFATAVTLDVDVEEEYVEEAGGDQVVVETDQAEGLRVPVARSVVEGELEVLDASGSSCALN